MVLAGDPDGASLSKSGDKSGAGTKTARKYEMVNKKKVPFPQQLKLLF